MFQICWRFPANWAKFFIQNFVLATAAGVRDARKIYQKQGNYTPEIRDGLREVISKNKQTNPQLYAKPTKK